jgi:hypothetical protein
MSRRVVLLVAAASLSCTRPNPLFALSEGPVAADDDDDASPPAASGGASDSGFTGGSTTTGGPAAPPDSTTTGTTTGTTEPVATDTTGTDASGQDTCDTECDDPDKECLGGLNCTGKLEWLRRSGDAAIQRASDAAVLSDGSIVLVGEFSGELGALPGIVTAGPDPKEADGFILRLDPAGEQLWIRQIGGLGLQTAHAVVALPDDRIAVAGRFTGQLELDPHQIADLGFGLGPAFVAVLDADGNALAVHVLGGDDLVAHDLAAGPLGGLVVVGSYSGDIFIGGNKTVSDARDIFAVGLDPDTGPLWSWLPPAPGDQAARAVAVSSSGAVFLGGELTSALSIAGIELLGDGVDGFIAALDDLGAPQWGARLGGPAHDRVQAIAAAPDDTFVITGVHGGGLDFGDGVLLPDLGGQLGGYVAAFDAAGALQWSHADFRLGAEASGVAVDPTGRVVLLLGVGDQPIDLGGGPLGPTPGALVVKLTGAGNFVWGRHLAGQVALVGAGLGVGPAGQIAVAGGFDLTLTHAPLELVSAGQLDVFAGRLLP